MKHFRLFFRHFIALIAVFSCSFAANAHTLPQVVRETLATNPQILAAKANKRASKQFLKQAWSGHLPTISLSTARGREESENPTLRNLGISTRTLNREERSVFVNEPIFSGFRVRNEVKRQRFELESADHRVIDSQENTTLQVAEAYLNVLRNRKLVQLARDNVAAHRETLRKVQLIMKGGAGRRVEVSLAEGRLSLAKSRLVNLIGQQQAAIANYIAVTGVAPARHLERPNTTKVKLPKSLEQAVDVAFANNPLLRAIKADYEAAKSEIGVAKSRFLPNVDLQLSATDNRDLDGIPGRNRDALVMAVVSYDAFNGGADYAAVRAAKEKSLEAKHVVEQAYRGVMELVRRTWAELQANRNRTQKLHRYAEYSRQVVIDYKKQFTIGKRALFNVLDAENELFTARSAHVNASIDRDISTYRLLASLGKLNANLLAES